MNSVSLVGDFSMVHVDYKIVAFSYAISLWNLKSLLQHIKYDLFCKLGLLICLYTNHDSEARLLIIPRGIIPLKLSS